LQVFFELIKKGEQLIDKGCNLKASNVTRVPGSSIGERGSEISRGEG